MMTNEIRARQKSRNFKIFRFLLPFVMRYPLQLIIATITLLVAAITTLSIPLAVRKMIDLGFQSANTEVVDKYFVFVLIVVIFAGVTSATRFFFVSTIGERVVADIRQHFFNHVMNLNLYFFEKMKTGEIISRIIADTTILQNMIGSSISVALRNFILLFGALILMIVTSPALSLFIAVGLPVVIFPLIVLGKRLRGLSKQTQDCIAEMSAQATESIAAIRVIQAFTYEKQQKKNFKIQADKAFESAKYRIKSRSYLIALGYVLIFSLMIAVIWLGAQYTLSGDLTVGVLGQFIIYILFASMAFISISEVWNSIQLAAGATERLVEILHIEPAIAAPKHPKELPHKVLGNIEFDNVSFQYPSRKNVSALQNISLKVKAGERIALVGHSGAGKSTIFQLLLRFYDPQKGQVKIEGIDIKQLDPRMVRQNIAFVPQDNVLFSVSIMENIRLGRPNATDEDVLEVAKAALVDDFVQDLPQKYETLIGEASSNISGGQSQRLMIARAMLRNSPILILDEATSALDAESEELVQMALEKLTKNSTSIVIAHRLATILEADRIVVMEKGKILNIGTHQELLQKDDVYKRLAELQLDR